MGTMGFHGERGLGAAFGGMGDRREVTDEKPWEMQRVSRL